MRVLVLKNIGIGRRLALGFGVLLTLLLLVGGAAVAGLHSVHEASTDLATNWLRATRALGDLEAALSIVRRGEALTVMARSPQDFDQQAQRIAASRVSAAESWKRYRATIDQPEEARLAKTIESALAVYYADLDRNLETARAGERGQAEEIYRSVTRRSFDAATAAIAEDVEFQSRGGEQAYEESLAAYTRTLVLVIAAALAAAAMTVGVAWVLTRSIVRPLQRAVKLAETVAAGDLSSSIHSDARDEAGQLLRALRHMNEALAALVGRVRDSSDSISTGSVQIAAGNADLSQRTEAQAGNLQQTAASMEELTATVRLNADTARQASALAGSAAQAAEQGGAVVEGVVATMREISDSATRIAEIIGVVDGIAFQTNILALNAAVEAARAGEQGRGFAVVAGEVRTLAQRSAHAAREIKALISASLEKVEAGSSLADGAGRSMDEIVAQVRRVSGLIEEISAASTEQSQGIGQVGSAISELDRVTQQNAALVQQSAAAAENLSRQARQLTDAVAGFRT